MTSIAERRDTGTAAGKADPGAAAEEMARALGAGWLELWYQPKIGSQTLDLRGAEALIRMRHPELGIIAPAGFMPRMGGAAFARALAIRHCPGTRRLALFFDRAAPPRSVGQSADFVSG